MENAQLQAEFQELRTRFDNFERMFDERREMIHDMNNTLQTVVLQGDRQGMQIKEMEFALREHNVICAAQKQEFGEMLVVMRQIQDDQKFRKRLRDLFLGLMGAALVGLQIYAIVKDLI